MDFFPSGQRGGHHLLQVSDARVQKKTKTKNGSSAICVENNRTLKGNLKLAMMDKFLICNILD
jgi:hypothetical protein